MGAPTVLYNGDISGALIAASIPNALSGANIIQIPYGNGMKVLIIG